MVAVEPVRLDGAWKVTSVAESKIFGTAAPLTSTVTAAQVAGTGVTFMQFP
jgi:hypothetical protein